MIKKIREKMENWAAAAAFASAGDHDSALEIMGHTPPKRKRLRRRARREKRAELRAPGATR